MIKNISIDLLVPFENHPFKKRSGIEQQELTESIKENGLLEPIIVRSFPAGKYFFITPSLVRTENAFLGGVFEKFIFFNIYLSIHLDKRCQNAHPFS